MVWSSLLAIALFALVMSGTPGPNNVMLLASGARFGFYRTLPHMFGITIGTASLISLVLLGLGALFSWMPSLYTLLQWLGGGYLLWLAWKIASSPVGEIASDSAQSRPMTLVQALLFQYVNPKAWMMAISSVSAFSVSGDLYWQSGLAIVLVFSLVNFPVISVWACLGMGIKRLLTNEVRQRRFNVIMGLATAATLAMIVAD
ncbi:LysE family translocator [Marinomonas epiphytica]